MGRSTAFNATLFFTSLFGVTSSLATTFPMLCITLFFLGTAVGVSRNFKLVFSLVSLRPPERVHCQQTARFS